MTMLDRDQRTSDASSNILAHRDLGDGPALLFIHSGIADSRMWELQRVVIGAEFRCVFVDLRGSGKSGPPASGETDHGDLRRLMDHLGIEQAVLVGSSYGGSVAVDFALTHPASVRALVLVATLAGMTSPGPGLARIWEETDAALAAGEIERGVELELRAWVDGPHRAPEHVNPDVRELMRAMNRAIWERAASGPEIEPGESEIDRVGRLGELSGPVLLIEGELDQPDVLSSMNRLAEFVPHAERIVMPDVAHFPNLERPDAFNAAVLSFLRRLPEAGDRKEKDGAP